jgi:hypothetical protein
MGAIETWSSRLAEVGIESTLAGNAAVLFSERGEEARQAAVEVGVDEVLRPPFADARQVGQHDAQQVGSVADGLGVEVAT